MIGQQPAGLVLLWRSCHNKWVNVTELEFIQTDLHHMLCQTWHDRTDWPFVYITSSKHTGVSPAQPSPTAPLQNTLLAGIINTGGHSVKVSVCVRVRGLGGATNCPEGREREREVSLYFRSSSAQASSTLEFSQPVRRGEIFILQLSIWIFDCNICIEEKWSWSAFCSARHSLFLVIIS